MTASWLMPPWRSLEEFPAARIARSLGALNRYGGAHPPTKPPLSVARHSVLVCHLIGGLDAETHLGALIHDAHECWSGDIAKPFFEEDLPAYSRDVIRSWQRRIDQRLESLLQLDLDPVQREQIRLADQLAAELELKWLENPAACPNFEFRYVMGSHHEATPAYDAELWLATFERIQQRRAIQ